MLPARFVIGQKHEQNDEASSRASWNTPRSDSRSTISYSSRMALAFALTALMTVGVLIVVVSVTWSGVFADYTRANVEEIARLTAERLADEYEADGELAADKLVAVADSSLISDDLGIQVLDADGNIVYDDTWIAAPVVSGSDEEAAASEDAAEEDAAGADAAPAGEVPDAADEGVAEGSSQRTHSFTSTAPTDQEGAVTVPVKLDSGETVGKVRVWVLGSDMFLTKADSTFRENTFNAMVGAAAAAVVIAIVIGLIFSRAFAHPIRRITSTAKQIRDGDLSARTGLKGDDEIDQLGETFDEMAASLEKDLKRERRLTADVAHELRTPLMAMLATVEAMQDEVMPADYEHLETVASETRRLSRLVQQMIELSRLESKTAPMNVETVEMLSFVRNIVNSQEQLFRARDLKLRFADETQGREVEVECDPDMITQCVINLLSNAMRYTPEGGWVVVSVYGDRRDVMIAVSDTGIGIAKEDLSRIFGRFWRADASRAREAGGLGVGLAVTRQIIERHHGYISVESELEKGTTFTIHLPREHTGDSSSSTMEA